MSVAVTPFAEEDSDAWTDFVEECPEAWLHHLPEFAAAQPGNCSFSVRVDGRIAGVCVLARGRRKFGAVLSGPGLALATGADRDAIYRAVGDALRRLARRERCQAVEFVLPPLAPAFAGRGRDGTVLAALGFSRGLRWAYDLDFIDGYYSVIDLTQEMETILKGYSKGNRASAARCRKMGMSVVPSFGAALEEAAWENFRRIHRATYARSHGTPFTDSRLARLAAMVRAGRLALINIHRGSECVATVLLEIYKQGASYFAGGATDEARQQGAMAFAQYAAMEWAKGAGCVCYSMGPTYPALSDTPFGANGEFKKRFGGARWEILAGEMMINPLAHLARIRMPAALRRGLGRAMPPRARAALRRLRAGRTAGGAGPDV